MSKPPKIAGIRRLGPVIEAELVDDIESSSIAVRSTDSRSRTLYEAFLADKSEITAKNYRLDLQHFARFLGCPDVPSALRLLGDLKDGATANELIHAYKVTLKKSDGYSASTINRRLAAIKSITKLARLFGVIDWTVEIPGEKARTFQDTSGCGLAGFELLLGTLEQEIADHAEADTPVQAARRWRDRALLHLMYYAGLRRMEPLTASYPQDLRTTPDGTREIRIMGKMRDGAPEWVPIGDIASRALSDWLEHRGDSPGPLFPGRKSSRPLHRNSVNNLVARLAKAAGVDITPHGLRHTAITELLEATDSDVRMAQRFARHSNPATTMIYDDNRKHLAARGVKALEDHATSKKSTKKGPR